MRALRYLWIPLFSLALMAQTTGSTGSTTPTRTRRRAASSARTKKTTAAPATADEIQSLREALATQQQQIQQLTQQLQQRDQASEQQQQQINQLQTAAADAQSKATTAADTAKAMQSDVTDLKANATTTALNLQEEQKHVTELTESPLAIHYKGITITPGGFLAAETVWRQRGLASDVNTPFNTIPFAGFNSAHLHEFFGTGRTSRITLLAEGKLSMAKLTGYYETDWLSAGITSNNNQSNSYTNRMRQLWGQAALNDGLTFTGGHMWSLVTETKNGMDNRTEATPSVIDHAYNVGFSWARQYGFRITKNFSNLVWLGFSIENAQTTLTAHGNLSNFVFGAPGTSGGAFNPTANYSFNPSPDFVFKVVYQPKIGHYEVVGVVSQFRDRIFPNVTATPATSSSLGAFTDSRTGGGIGANARWLVFSKHLELGVHGFGGDGVGRYGASGLPDSTVRPNGTLALLHSYQGLGTIEVHYPKFDVYFNGGGEYISRWSQLRTPTTAVGYGSPLFNNSGCSIEAVPAGGNGFTPGTPSNCNADTRSLEEFTTGFYIKFYNGPKGRVQWGPQYSYIVRNTWRGVGNSPHTNENMFLTSFRYYLP
ncbi:MAG TPA: hypothetical protein VFB76_18685 [Candidatus Angelobacter sp.]|nr:hypothetical protein [Candidatus Angelobacter sp.]